MHTYTTPVDGKDVSIPYEDFMRQTLDVAPAVSRIRVGDRADPHMEVRLLRNIVAGNINNASFASIQTGQGKITLQLDNASPTAIKSIWEPSDSAIIGRALQPQGALPPSIAKNTVKNQHIYTTASGGASNLGSIAHLAENLARLDPTVPIANQQCISKQLSDIHYLITREQEAFSSIT